MKPVNYKVTDIAHRVMEKKKDSLKNAVSSVDALPRRPQRVTTVRDSPGDLHEKVRLRDREQSINKGRDRAYLKRRRVDRSTESYKETGSTETSDEEYYQDKEDNASRINRTNQRGVRKIWSSPAVLRAAAHEVIDVVVPRRTRSSLAKRLHEQLDSDFGDVGRRRSAPATETARLYGFGGDSLTCSLKKEKKKKMKSAVYTGTHSLNCKSYSKPPLMVEEDEIEVAEALFDLMNPRKVDRGISDASNTETKRLRKAESDEDEENAFSVENEPKAETDVAGSIDEMSKEDRVDRVKLPDGPREPVRSLNKGKVGSCSSNDSGESPSCVKVNASENQDLSPTKKDYLGTVAGDGKEKMLDDDFLGARRLMSSSDKVAMVDNKVLVFDAATRPKLPKKEKEEAIKSNQPGKHRHDVLNIQNAQLQQKNQSLPSLFPMAPTLGSWSGILPYPGYMPPQQAVLPIEGSAPTGIQVPQFKFSQPRLRRCTTHQYIASNIRHHQQLIKGSLSPMTLYNGKMVQSPNPKFVSGNALHGTAPQGGQSFANISGSSEKDSNGVTGLLQNPHQATSYSSLNGPSLIFPFGYNQGMGASPQAYRPGPSQCNASLPTGKVPSSTNSLSFNSNLTFSSKEAAASYMAMLQSNNGCAFPMPPSKGGPQSPVVPFFNSSYYPSPVFNAPQNLQHAQKSPQPSSVTAHPQQAEKLHQSSNLSLKPDMDVIVKTGGPSSADGSIHQFAKLPNGQTWSFPVQLMNFAAIPTHTMMNGVLKNGDMKQQEMNSKFDGVNFIPSSSSSESSLTSSGVPVTIPNIPNHHQLRKHHGTAQDNDFSGVKYQAVSLSSQGPTNVSFLNNSAPSLPSTYTLKSSGGVDSRNASFINKNGSQGTGASSTQNPACNRNVPSILLSKCNEQVSELK